MVDKNQNKSLYTPPNWLLSGRKFTVISLIVLPFILVFSHYMINENLLPPDKVIFNSIGKYEYNDCLHTLVPEDVVLLNKAYIFSQYSAFILILFIYPPYPAPFTKNIKSYFTRRGFETAVFEYELIKKILYIMIPLIIITASLTVIHNLDYKTTFKKSTLCGKKWVTKIENATLLPEQFHPLSSFIHPHRDTFYYLQLLLLLIIISAIFKIVCAIGRKSFRLYFAKGCFILMNREQDEVEKMRYFVMAFNSYSLYLRRQIKLEIADLKKIYSKISTSPAALKNEAIDKISMVFQKDQLEYDNYTLEPVRYLYKFLNMPETQILTQQLLTNKLKDYGNAAIVLVPTAVLILNTFKQFTLPHI